MTRHQNARKTLFLDFDGVLHPSSASEGCYFVHADRLVASLGNSPCEIVISSSWRFAFELQKIKRKLPDRMAGRIVATTGDAYIGPFARYNEILEYLALNPCGDWRALDDSTFEFPAKFSKLIACDGRKGLDNQVLTHVSMWLQAC